MSEQLTLSNPYVGPRPYNIEEKRLFFGRDTEARALLPLVIAERLVLFYAQSGAGKSSLINARLIPGLQERNFYVLPIGRVSRQREEAAEVDNPFIYDLLLSLQSENIRVSAADRLLAHTTLPEYLANLIIEEPPPMESGGGSAGRDVSPPPDAQHSPVDAPQIIEGVRPLALIIDQFEEIFTTYPEEWEKRVEFFEQLRQAQEADPYLWMVLVIREDYIARLDPYAHLLFGGLRARFYMERMGYEAALDAVSKPVYNLYPFAPGVAEELVNNLRRLPHGECLDAVSENPLGQYVEPVQLQVVCYQLWEQLNHEEKKVGSLITRNDLNRLARGGDLGQFISSALADFYEQAIASVVQAIQNSPEHEDITERKLRDWFSTRMITESETCDLVFKGDERTGGMPNQAVELLAQKFIIRTENRGASTWYELSHDRFVGPILQANRAWYERNPRPILTDALIWMISGKSPEKLYEGRQLKAALPMLDDPQADLSEVEREFIRASQFAANQQQTRRSRTLFLIYVLLVIILTALTVFSIKQANIARSQKTAADIASGLAHLQSLTAEAASRLEAQQRQTAEAASAQEVQQRQTAEAAAGTAEAAGSLARQRAEEADRARTVAWNANIEAQSSRLSSLSDYFRTTKPDLSLLLAIEAFKTANSLESRRALLNSIQNGITNRSTRAGFPWYVASRPYSIAFSPDGSLVAVGTLGRIYLWDTASREPVLNLPASFAADYSMFSVAFDSTGNLLARSGGDGNIIIWDRQAGSTKSIHPFIYTFTSILSIAFQPGGSLLAAGTDIYPSTGKGQVYLYNNLEGTKVATYNCGGYACVRVAWSPNGNRLAIAGKDGAIQVIDIAQNKNLLIVPRAHNGEISGLAWYPDGRRLVSSGYDQRLIQWDIDTQAVIRQYSFPGKSVPISLALSPDGRFLLAGVNEVGDWFGMWNAETLQKLEFTPSGHTRPVTAVAFSVQGNHFVTTGFDNAVVLWNFEPVDSLGTLLVNLAGPRVEAVGEDQASHLVFARNTGNGLLDIITEGVNQPLTLRAPHAGLAFVQTASHPAIATGGVDGKVTFIDPATGASLRDMVMSAGGQVRSLAVSADGRLLAAASCKSSNSCERLILRDLQTGEVLPLKSELGPLELKIITSLAFSPDGKTLSIGTISGKIILYDIATGEIRQAVTEGLQNVTVAVTSLAYSPAEQGLLIAGFQDGRIALWDASTLGPVGEFVERLNGEVTSLLLRKSATSGLLTLVSTSSPGEILEWEIDTQAWVARACQMAGRNLTSDEKTKFLLPGNPQEDVCPAKQAQ